MIEGKSITNSAIKIDLKTSANRTFVLNNAKPIRIAIVKTVNLETICSTEKMALCN